MRSLLAILLLLLLSGAGRGLEAQDLTGQWTGTATDDGSDRKQKVSLTITESDSAVAGVLHWYFPETQYIRHLVISGRFYGRDSVLTIREDSIMGVPGEAARAAIYPKGTNEGRASGPGRSSRASSSGWVMPMGDSAAGFHILYYRRMAGHKDVLEGYWRGDLTIRLEKKAPPFIPLALPIHKKKDSVLSKQDQALQSRESPVAATIPVRGTDTVRIELYDNGEIDGDSVSLYLNNELLLQHLRLTAEGKVLLVPIDKSLPVNRLILFAENLGKLPPNTALMEVTVHGKTYHLFLSTDYKRNASIEFTLQE
jgi:hypothetical protein